MRRISGLAWLIITLVAANLLLLAPSIIRVATGIVVFPSAEVRRHFEPDFEGNLFTWYSSVLLAGSAFMALANFWLDGKQRNALPWRPAWLGVFLVMMVLSAEEVAQFHESVQAYVQLHGVGWAGQDGEGLYWLDHVGKGWLLPYSVAIVGVIGFFVLAFNRIFGTCGGARILALGGLCLWITVLVLEFFSFEIGTWGRWYAIVGLILEEGAELFGTTAMLVALVWRAWDSSTGLSIPHKEAMHDIRN